MTSPTNEQQRVDVLAVMDRMNDLIRGEFIGPDDLDLTDEGLIEKGQQVRAAVAELIEAGRELQAGMDENDNRPMDAGPAKRFLAADARHRAALANVGSQP